MKTAFTTLFILCLSATTLMAQQMTQTIRGQVTDNWTKVSLPGANIMVVGSNPPLGAITDMDGYFVLESVPVGRVSLSVSFIGYESQVLSNIELSSAKELVINVALSEKVTNMEAVTVTATKNKVEPLNKMSTVSTRAFSVEESQRFAGARNDVSRMAANFAGINTANDASNDIVIRGNSPNGLLWRMEGIDIPNPNHFGGTGATGGPVSMLNNNVLANSDFMTGAFPAEYGNALSGVFDLQMRNGNSSKHEFLGQIGINGFELGAEGPISKEKRSSYLVNARYSTLSVMSAMGIEFGTGAAIPEYQDVTFKFNLPTEKWGRFTVFGLAGKSHIEFLDSERDTTDSDEDFYTEGDPRDVYVNNNVGVIGMSHTYILNPNTYTKVTVGLSTIGDDNDVDSLSAATQEPHFLWKRNYTTNTFQVAAYINKKLNARHNLRIGGLFKNIHMDLEDQLYYSSSDEIRTVTAYDGATNLLQPYAQWQYRTTDRLTFNTGIRMQYLTLNGASAVEPRIGVRYQVADHHALSFAYGMHSQTAPIDVYFKQVYDQQGQTYRPNEDLDLTHSQHFVLGYDWTLSETMRLKSEVYYQSITDAVVEVESSSYSLLNGSTFDNDSPDFLKNGGTGENYGLELTLEKFMDRGLYFLLTTSLFESTYEGSNGVTHNTAFNTNYVVNTLGGKEFKLKSKPAAKYQKLIALDLRMTFSGGKPYTPALEDESAAAGELVEDESRAYEEQFDPYFRMDVRTAYRWSNSKLSQEFALDVQNVTNKENPLYLRWNTSTNEIEAVNQLGLFPMVQYRVVF